MPVFLSTLLPPYWTWSFFLPEDVLWKEVLRFFQKPQENTCTGASFLIKLPTKDLDHYYKDTPAQIFCSKFCNTLFHIKSPGGCVFTSCCLIFCIFAYRITDHFDSINIKNSLYAKVNGIHLNRKQIIHIDLLGCHFMC